MNGETPNLHLTFTDDARVNANWEKIDSFLGLLQTATIIPNDLQVQGNLDVIGNATIAGTLTANSATLPSMNVGSATIANLSVGGSLTGPAGLIAQGLLALNASQQGLWISTIQTGTLSALVTTPQQLCTLLTDANEVPNRYALVLGQLTLQIGLSTDPTTAVPIAMRVDLTRGTFPGVLQQSRSFSWTMARAGFFQAPVTISRIALPPAVTDEARWNLSLTMTTTSGLAQLSNVFSQLQVLQLT